MFGTLKSKPSYIGNGRRPLGISLEWPQDGDASRAIVRVQKFDRRRDSAGKMVYTPLGTGWTIPPADVFEFASKLGRIAEFIKAGSL